jgi:hypothetical protein
LKDVGVNVGMKVAQQTVQRVPGAFLMAINKAVGFRLLTKAGTTGVINLSKIIPFIGGLVSGAYDAATTKGIGEAARAIFAVIPEVASAEEEF